MKQFPNAQALALAGLLAIAPSASAVAQDAGTSFFVTSVDLAMAPTSAGWKARMRIARHLRKLPA